MVTATCRAPPCEACPSTRCHGLAFCTAFLLPFWIVKKADTSEAGRRAAGDGPSQPLTEASGEPALEDPPTELPRSAAIAEPEHPGVVVRFSPTFVDQLLDWSGPSEIKLEQTSPARMDSAHPPTRIPRPCRVEGPDPAATSPANPTTPTPASTPRPLTPYRRGRAPASPRPLYLPRLPRAGRQRAVPAAPNRRRSALPLEPRAEATASALHLETLAPLPPPLPRPTLLVHRPRLPQTRNRRRPPHTADRVDRLAIRRDQPASALQEAPQRKDRSRSVPSDLKSLGAEG